MKKRIILAVSAILVLGLLAGCSGGKTLTVEISGPAQGPQTWRLVDTGSKAEIRYSTLQYAGQTVVKTAVMSSFSGSLYLAFEEDQLVVEGTKTTYNGGTAITHGSNWKYTLEDGVLNILE